MRQLTASQKIAHLENRVARLEKHNYQYWIDQEYRETYDYHLPLEDPKRFEGMLTRLGWFERDGSESLFSEDGYSVKEIDGMADALFRPLKRFVQALKGYQEDVRFALDDISIEKKRGSEDATLKFTIDIRGSRSPIIDTADLEVREGQPFTLRYEFDNESTKPIEVFNGEHRIVFNPIRRKLISSSPLLKRRNVVNLVEALDEIAEKRSLMENKEILHEKIESWSQNFLKEFDVLEEFEWIYEDVVCYLFWRQGEDEAFYEYGGYEAGLESVKEDATVLAKKVDLDDPERPIFSWLITVDPDNAYAKYYAKEKTACLIRWDYTREKRYPAFERWGTLNEMKRLYNK